MKFAQAWALALKESMAFKVISVFLFLILFVTSFTFLKTLETIKRPLVVGKGIETTILAPSSDERTHTEIEEFLRRALVERFTTKQKFNDLLLADSELRARKIEMMEMEKKELTQKIVVNEIFTQKEEILVDADRILSFKDVRSAFHFPLKVKIETVPRRLENPHGLVLSKVEFLDKEDGQ